MDTQKLAQDTHNKHHKSIVLIIIRSASGELVSRGSGFIIGTKDTSCIVMTCNHCVKKLVDASLSVSIRIPGVEKELTAAKMNDYCDEEADIAIIKVNDVTVVCEALQFCEAANIPRESVVVMLGYLINSGQHPLNPSVIVGTVTTPLELNRLRYQDLKVSIGGKHGLSGSALMSGDEVVAIAYSVQSGSDILNARPSGTINLALRRCLKKPSDAITTTKDMILDILEGI